MRFALASIALLIPNLASAETELTVGVGYVDVSSNAGFGEQFQPPRYQPVSLPLASVGGQAIVAGQGGLELGFGFRYARSLTVTTTAVNDAGETADFDTRFSDGVFDLIAQGQIGRVLARVGVGLGRSQLRLAPRLDGPAVNVPDSDFRYIRLRAGLERPYPSGLELIARAEIGPVFDLRGQVTSAMSERTGVMVGGTVGLGFQVTRALDLRSAVSLGWVDIGELRQQRAQLDLGVGVLL